MRMSLQYFFNDFDENFSDDEPLSYESRPTYDYAASNSSVAVLNVSHAVDWTDNGKMVRCLAHHIALDGPKETKQDLQVYCEYYTIFPMNNWHHFFIDTKRSRNNSGK